MTHPTCGSWPAYQLTIVHVVGPLAQGNTPLAQTFLPMLVSAPCRAPSLDPPMLRGLLTMKQSRPDAAIDDSTDIDTQTFDRHGRSDVWQVPALRHVAGLSTLVVNRR